MLRLSRFRGMNDPSTLRIFLLIAGQYFYTILEGIKVLLSHFKFIDLHAAYNTGWIMIHDDDTDSNFTNFVFLICM